MNAQTTGVEPFDAWNPGLNSDIPAPLWPLVTLLREENSTVSYAQAKELSDLTGLRVLELIALRPERLVVHALLVRVTADLSVPDGPNYEDLGINLRGMVHAIYTKYMLPEMSQITAAFDTEKKMARQYVEDQLNSRIFKRQATELVGEKQTLLQRLFSSAAPVADASDSSVDEPIELVAVKQWKIAAESCEVPLERSCLTALAKTVDIVVGHRGKLMHDVELLTDIVVNQVANNHGADVIDAVIKPLWDRGIVGEGYTLLPTQDKPVVLNVKGASASGKSTIRPQQRQLAAKLGKRWEDFALISTDYWRKYLLDYESLGDDRKYAAMLTGNELEVVDKRLDRYMNYKSSCGELSHLLIDRFRFDSFVVEKDSRLLSRFGDRVFLFFMVTHPAETVVRAWSRGNKTGRYKAVDDLLYHNVEAYNGMPSLFLSWVNSETKQIHFEFLDNDVEEGELPRTGAFGSNHTLTILDVSLFLNIDRYRKVNISATRPDEIFKDTDLAAHLNTGFIVECAQKVPEIYLADQNTAFVYARVSNGELVWWDQEYVELHLQDDDLRQTLIALGYENTASIDPAKAPEPIDIEGKSRITVGRWNSS